MLRSGLDVQPALDELNKLNAWNWLDLRKQFPNSCHRRVDDVVMRFAPIDRPLDFTSVMDGLETVSYLTWYSHAACRNLVEEALEQSIFGREDQFIGRVMASQLKPGAEVYPHTDEGAYARAHDRIHIALASDEGNIFTCGGEECWMLPGEVWLFDHEKPHHVVNASNLPRVHLIVDVKR